MRVLLLLGQNCAEIISLINLFIQKNAPVKLRGRYQMNLAGRAKL